MTDGERIIVDSPSVEPLFFGVGISFKRFDSPMPKNQAWDEIKEETKTSSDWIESLAQFISREEVDERPNV